MSINVTFKHFVILKLQAQHENKQIKWNGKNLFVNGKEVRAQDIPDSILSAAKT